jgi:3-hydroxyisobutyrate dehydrogenase-like beta-hydroxyacid dehydrogenase
MSDRSRPPVTVIGLGPMGQAMARALMDGGHPVAVWNRTPDRADDLVAAGAARAATPADAVAAADLVVVSLTDYRAMYDILAPDGGPAVDVAGRVVVNLSSDTPERTREAAVWAQDRGARFLTGGVMVPAPMIGTDDAYVYYSGPRALLDAHEPTLRLIGAPRYVGEDPGLAQLYYQAQLDVFLTALAGLLHGTALVGSAGVTAERFVPDAVETLVGIGALLEEGPEVARQIDQQSYPGDLSTTTMMGATADHIVGASRAAGLDLELPHAVRSLYDRAIQAGHGPDNWTSLIEVIKNRRSDG